MHVVVTSVRKKRNFKNCIRMDFLTFSKHDFQLVDFSSKSFPHCVVTSVRKEGRD